MTLPFETHASNMDRRALARAAAVVVGCLVSLFAELSAGAVDGGVGVGGIEARGDNTGAPTSVVTGARSGRVAPMDGLERLAQGNAAYREGRFAEAWQTYLELLDGGYASSGLYFNIGNAAYRLGRRSLGLAAFRLAQDMAPRDPEIVANIAFLKSGLADRRTMPRDRTRDLLDWLGLLNQREYLYLTSGLLTLLFLGLALRALIGGRTGRLHRATLALTIGVGVLCPIVAGAGLWVRASTAPGARCITLDRSVVLRSEASASSLSLFEIPAVAELGVLDRLPTQLNTARGDEFPSLEGGSDEPRAGGWIRVRLGEGLSGWLPSEDVIVF